MDRTYKRYRKRRKGNQRGKRRVASSRIVPFYPSIRQGVSLSPKLRANVQYVAVQSLAAAASSTKAYRWKTNDPYDVDINVGNTNSVAFAEMTALYKTIVVLRYYYDILLVNTDTNPVFVYILNTNFDPTTTTTNHPYESANPHCRKYVCGGVSGTGVKIIRGVISIADIYGKSIEDNPQFFATDGSSPANVLWLTVSVQSATGSFLTNGCSVNLSLTLECDFFERKVLIT